MCSAAGIDATHPSRIDSGVPAKPSALVDTRVIYGCCHVEQRRNISDPVDIDAFEAVMMREERMLGYFVGFDFTGDALFEIDRLRRKEGREIKPLTVREILDEEMKR